MVAFEEPFAETAVAVLDEMDIVAAVVAWEGVLLTDLFDGTLGRVDYHLGTE